MGIKYYLILLFIIIIKGGTQGQPLSLIVPKDKYICSENRIKLEWNSLSGRLFYELQISKDRAFSNIVIEEAELDTSLFNFIGLESNREYYWRVRGMSEKGWTGWSEVWSFRAFSPGILEGIELWLRADSGVVKDEQNRISKWKDISKNGRDAKQDLVEQMPVYRSNTSLLNNKAVVGFGRGNAGNMQSILDFPQMNLINGEMTIVVLYKLNSLADRGYPGDKWQVLMSGEGWNVLFARNHSLNGFDIENMTSQIATSNLAYPDFQLFYIDKNDIYINNKLANYIKKMELNETFNFKRLGSRSDNLPNWQFFYGDMAEIIIYNKVFSDSIRDLITEYVKQRYTPAVNLGRDIYSNYGFCNTTLDAGDRFKYFQWSTGESTQTISVNKTGKYYVKVWDIFGNTSVDTVYLYKSILKLRDTTICLNQAADAEFNTGLDTTEYKFLWSDGSIGASLKATKEGKYWVKITDSLGCSLIDTVNIKIDSSAVWVNLGEDRTICSGEFISFSKGKDNIKTYLWSDGSAEDKIKIMHSGDYSLTVTSKTGCIFSDTVKLTIKGIIPQADFSFDTVCQGYKTSFKDLSIVEAPYNINLWDWDFGDKNSSDKKDPEHLYAKAGEYEVNLIAWSGGCLNLIKKTVKVKSLPIPAFSPDKGCSGVAVNFLDKTRDKTGNINKWEWNFNDINSGSDNISFSQNPIHNFSEAGYYFIKLIVESESACADSLTQKIEIRKSPIPDFSYTEVCKGNETNFKDLTECDSYHRINQWTWDFGDYKGKNALIKNPVHLYDTAKQYKVSLEVKSLNGCSAKIIKTVSVFSIPEAGFISKDICSNVPGQLIDTSKTAIGNISSWNWELFKNKEAVKYADSQEEHPYFSIADTGLYKIKLKVITNKGCVDTCSGMIKVIQPPLPQFSFKPEYGTAPQKVNFSNHTPGDNTYFWSFGDGGTSDEAAPSYTYNKNGVFKIKLFATNKTGCIDSSFADIYIMNLVKDIGLQKVYAAKNNNFISMSVDISNYGTIPVKDLTLSAAIKGSNPIIESWTGELLPGGQITYNFHSRYEILQDLEPDYICFEAQMTEDVNPDNNTKCFNFSEGFIVYEPYPNPVYNKLYLELIAPQSAMADIYIYNYKGAALGNFFSKRLNKGVNNIVLNIAELDAGIYLYRINFNNTYKIKKFIKL
ncbi:MAG: PKD domain-containing protein [Bacteroidales bacterium]|nr:PKD domain-containing protein [Bacteroidales bacterium]